MFVCHSHNFIFLRIPKNASSSIAHFLVEKLGDPEKDLWTDVNDRGGPKMNKVDSKIKSKYRHHARYIHLTLQELITEGLVSKENAMSMEKIGIIRNPLERQLSLYFWLCRNRKEKHDVSVFRKQFQQGRHESDSNNKFTQVQYLSIDGELRENTTFWKYEDLEKMAQAFVRSKKPTSEMEIPKHKTNVAPNEDRATLIEKYYDENTKQAVLNYYSKDYELYQSL